MIAFPVLDIVKPLNFQSVSCVIGMARPDTIDGCVEKQPFLTVLQAQRFKVKAWRGFYFLVHSGPPCCVFRWGED